MAHIRKSELAEPNGFSSQLDTPNAFDSPILKPATLDQRKIRENYTIGKSYFLSENARTQRQGKNTPNIATPTPDYYQRQITRAALPTIQLASIMAEPTDIVWKAENQPTLVLPNLENGPHTIKLQPKVISVEQPPSTASLPANKHKKPFLQSAVSEGIKILYHPVQSFRLRRVISHLPPESKETIRNFIQKDFHAEISPDPPSRPKNISRRYAYPPYDLPTERVPTNKEQALETMEEVLSTISFLKQSSKIPSLFEGVSSQYQGIVEIRSTKTDDITCSFTLPDKNRIHVFLANPFDSSLSPTKRIAVSLQKPHQEKALFSLHVGKREQAAIQEIALQLARLSITNPMRPDRVNNRQKYKQHIFLTAIANAYQENFPDIHTTSIKFTGSTWPFLSAKQCEGNKQKTLSAYFHLYEEDERQEQAFDKVTPNLLLPDNHDLQIDSFFYEGSEQHKQNIFYVLPLHSAPRVITTDLTYDVNQQLLAAMRKRSIALLTAFRSVHTISLKNAPKTIRKNTLQRIDEVIARLQEFVLQFTPDGTKRYNELRAPTYQAFPFPHPPLDSSIPQYP